MPKSGNYLIEKSAGRRSFLPGRDDWFDRLQLAILSVGSRGEAGNHGFD